MACHSHHFAASICRVVMRGGNYNKTLQLDFGVGTLLDKN